MFKKPVDHYQSRGKALKARRSGALLCGDPQRLAGGARAFSLLPSSSLNPRKPLQP